MISQKSIIKLSLLYILKLFLTVIASMLIMSVMTIIIRFIPNVSNTNTENLLIAIVAGIAEIIEELSSGMTLLPGTIIATGTPSGVGMGFDPPKFLKTGDVVECAIEGIGVLRNTVR